MRNFGPPPDFCSGLERNHNPNLIPIDILRWRSAFAATPNLLPNTRPQAAYIIAKASPDGKQLIGLVSDARRLKLKGTTSVVPGLDWTSLDSIESVIANQ